MLELNSIMGTPLNPILKLDWGRKGCISHMMPNVKSHQKPYKKSNLKSNQEDDALEAHCFLLIFSSNSQKHWPWHDIVLSWNQFCPSLTRNYSLNIPKTLQVLLSSTIFDCQDWTIYKTFSKIKSLHTVRTNKQEVR